ncbi:MAG: aldo/keto reductase [Acidimicrobiales bacterium]
MKYRRLGKSGYDVSEVGLGCWQLGNDFGPVSDDHAAAILAAGDAADINFWDTADVYGDGLSERRIGDYTALHSRPRRVVTKVGRNADLYPDGYTKAKVRTSLENSLRRLGGDALDLAQLHCVPTAVLLAGDLLSWMHDFQRDGLLRHFGASVETMEEARFAVTHPALTSLQIIFNIFRQDAIEDLFPLAVEHDVGIIVRLPLASGVLSGKMVHGQQFAETDHRNFNRDGAAFSVGETFSGVPFEQAVDLAQEVAAQAPDALSPAQMALRWALDHPAVSTVIAGASRPEQVTENAAVSDLAPLPATLHEELATLYTDRVEHLIRGAR